MSQKVVRNFDEFLEGMDMRLYFYGILDHDASPRIYKGIFQLRDNSNLFLPWRRFEVSERFYLYFDINIILCGTKTMARNRI